MPFNRLSGDRNTASTLLLLIDVRAERCTCSTEGSTVRCRPRPATESGGQGWPVKMHSSLPAMTLLLSVSSVKKLPRYFLPEGAVTSRSRSRAIVPSVADDGSVHAMTIWSGCDVSQTLSV